jgi:hypothetical protein
MKAKAVPRLLTDNRRGLRFEVELRMNKATAQELLSILRTRALVKSLEPRIAHVREALEAVLTYINVRKTSY